MKVSSLFVAFVLSIVLTGCFKGEGQVRIDSNVQNAIIYIDGDKKGMTGDGYTTIILDEGDHEVRIYKEIDKEWYYEGTQKIFVGANSSVKVKIDTDKKPTEYKMQLIAKEKTREKKAEEERLAKEKKAEEERLAKEKKAEEERLAREKKAEEERLAKEKKAEEERLAREKKEREERLVQKQQERELKLIKTSKKLGFIVYPEDVFIDFDSGLIWQDNQAVVTSKKPIVTQANYKAKNYTDTWGDTATSYCRKLTLEGYSDWRLPTKTELEALYLSKEDLKYVSFDYYWSSSNYGNYQWSVYFGNGRVQYANKSDNLYVRCVRAGQ